MCCLELLKIALSCHTGFRLIPDRVQHLRVRGEQRRRHPVRLASSLRCSQAHHILRFHLGRAHSGKRQRPQQRQRVQSGIAIQISTGAEGNKVMVRTVGLPYAR